MRPVSADRILEVVGQSGEFRAQVSVHGCWRGSIDIIVDRGRPGCPIGTRLFSWPTRTVRWGAGPHMLGDMILDVEDLVRRAEAAASCRGPAC